MKDIIFVELKRVLDKRIFAIFFFFILVFSSTNIVSTLKNYNVYDNVGNIEISSIENLKESKDNIHRITLDYNNMLRIINREDKSKYMYNNNFVFLLLQVFNDKKFDEITESDIKHFYVNRVENFSKNRIAFLGEEEQKFVIEKVSELQEPMEVGYSLGWSTINSKLVDLVTIVMLFISFICVVIFGESQKGSMNDLLLSTKNGRIDLIKSKLKVGVCLSSIAYFISVAIFTICNLLILGAKGYDLYIQSSLGFLYSAYNITFFQQYLMNILLGFVAVLLMTYITIFVSIIFRKILNAGIVIIFIWILMFTLPNEIYVGYNFSHYFTNFLPYNIINFNKYYLYNDVYNLNGNIMFSYYIVSVITIIITLILAFITYILLKMKIKKYGTR
ncbi:MAG: hypothetical protein ACK5JH_13560 [Anaerocolumna sp.]